MNHRHTFLAIMVFMVTAMTGAAFGETLYVTAKSAQLRSLGSHMTERIFRTWYEGHAGQPAPAIVNPAAEPPPANVRAMIPLDVTEAEAKEFLESLGA